MAFNAAEVEINYGESEIYTRTDMIPAIEIVQETFGKFLLSGLTASGSS